MLAEVLVLMAGMMLATVGQWIAFEQGLPVFQTLDSHTKHEWVSRITAFVVEIALIGFALIQGRTSHWGACLMLAYLMHDTGHMLTYETDVSSYIHHIVSTTVFGLTRLTMTPDQADVTTLAMAMLESTSPLLHVTWVMKQAGYSQHPLFTIIAGVAAAFFGIMRCGVFPWFMATTMDRGTTLIFAPLMALNVYWFAKIVRLMAKVLASREGRKD
jgi:hypothetical protein